MIRLTNSIYCLLALSTLVIFSYCKKPVVYPPEPHLEFKEYYTSVDSIDALENKLKFVELTFTMIDGDGDIGMDSNMIIQNQLITHNIFLTLYVKDTGEFVKWGIAQDSSLQNFRIPYLEPEGSNRSIKADIKVKLSYPIPLDGNQASMPFDTVMFECYIMDRSLNKSNTVLTPVIIFPPH